MTSLKRYRVILNQKTPFLGVIDSIKIYGALVRAMEELYGEAKDFIKIIEKGEIRVSSPMPHLDGKFYIFKPDLPTEKLEYKDYKKFKRKKFIREDIAIRSLKKGMFSMDEIREIIKDNAKLIKNIETPGVSVGRLGEKTTIYYKDSFLMRKFWITISMEERWAKKVWAALKYVGDVGLSKKQSAGFGGFEIEKIENYDSPEDLKYRMIISKYIPNRMELNTFPFEDSRYEIGEISGYTREGYAIPLIRVIKEGAVYLSDKFSGIPIGRIIEPAYKYVIVGVPSVV